MAELKRNFSGAKMNKDMDERVLPSGQYRDALNVQISTSDGSDVGALQTLLGNTELSNNIVPDDYCTCVGAMALGEKDLIYYFVAGGGHKGYRPLIRKDYIIEYNTITNTFKYVFVDIYNVQETQVGNDNTSKYFIIDGNSASTNTTCVRVGMHITGTFTNHVGGATKTITFEDNVLVTDIVKDGSNWKVYHDYKWDNGSNGEAIPVTNGEAIYFHSEFGERVLQFNPLNKINNINHLDGMLFWTDGVNEPKKIHIERSLKGTGGTLQVVGWDDGQLGSHANNTGNLLAINVPSGFGDNANFHTRMVIDNPNVLGYQTSLDRTNVRPIWIKLDHITVIKKGPKFPLKLTMLETSVDRVPDATTTNTTPTANLTYAQTGNSAGAITAVSFSDGTGNPFEEGHVIGGETIANGFFFNQPVDFRVGDIILFTSELGVAVDSFEDELAEVRAKVTYAPLGMPNNGGEIGPYQLEIMSINSNISTTPLEYSARLDAPPSLFEFKFPRFSYRYKYTDGEYSTFAPWTEVAFLPGGFDYVCSKGYNLGMTNRMKSLRLTDYFSEFALMPNDVVQVDLLYKEDGKNEIYTVKEITKKDGAPQWPDTATSPYNRGQYDLTSEMIHALVPSNQLLRPWDNVPKSALTQEITSNRLIYGNYKQNYELAQDLKLDISFDHEYKSSQVVPSCKTLRTYQVGVVFSDKYGRETPVQIPTKSSSIYLDKKWSQYKNKLKVRVNSASTIPSWAEYMKFYVKETSNEYYNLAMDRWYNAEDGNIWISFPSAERNKVDEETFLILKNAHDSNNAVTEKARYKIIAISEDAPLFVKTTKKLHGSVATKLSGSGTGTTFSTANEVLITTTAWDAALGDTWMADVYSKIARGNLKVRLTATLGGVTMSTKFVSITSIRELGSDHAIRLSGPFGDDAKMSKQLSNGTIVNQSGLGSDSSFPTYSIEILENVVENKAEFDGRFFVKIYRDPTLETRVLTNAASASTVYNIASSHQTRLISGIGHDDDRRHPAKNQSNHTYHRGNFSWSTNANTYNQNYVFNSGDQMGHYNARYRTKDYWEGMTNRVDWFIDACGHGGDHSWDNGVGGFHDNSESHDNGIHPSHSDINGTGRGGIRHYSDKTRIYWGIMAHGSSSGDLGSQDNADFQALMTTAGTLFRWRDDPNNVVYRVLRGLGKRDTENYQHKSHSSSRPDKKRRQFVHEIVQHDNDLPMDPNPWDPLSAYKHDGLSEATVDIVTPDTTFGADASEFSTPEPAIWETEPKESVDVDIYYEASGSLPLDVTHKNNELLIPLFSTFETRDGTNIWHTDVSTGEKVEYKITAVNQTSDDDITKLTIVPGLQAGLNHDQYIKIYRHDGSYIVVYVSKSSGNYAAANTTMSGNSVIEVVTGRRPSNKQTPFGLQYWRAPHHQPQYLGWYNCWAFGNGVESDRIRDDFNAPQVANGVKASTVLAEPYAEEHRSSGMIFSGIFNSTSGVNNLNQFIQAEPITKDLSPRHGSIQKLVSRDTDTFAFCEDKVLRILTNKDALFNADGNANVTSNNAVLGQATPINGDYGISTNPESLAVTPFGMYWADQMRGQVLALEGGMSIKSISDIGMKDYFNDNLENLSELIGTYDEKKNEYNLTLCTKVHRSQFRPTTTTLSYNELTQGWISFKSFGPEAGISLNNQYYTFKEGSIWKHHNNTTTNNFYGTQYYSDFTLIFNDQPGSVKSFNTINYEGTQARISQFTTVSGKTDDRYDNLTAKAGWYVDSIATDLQEIDDIEFKNKEGKWFGTLKGVATTLDNLDEKEFSVQGLGSAGVSNSGDPATVYKINVHAHPTNAAGSTNWDSSGADADFKIGSFQVNSATAGSTVPAGTSSSYIDNLTLTNGLYTYSGLDLDAKNFSVPNGTATTSGSGNSTVYIYTAAAGWHADQNITKVEFRNQGIAGDPANVVEARAYYGSFTMPSSDYDRHFDVDHSGTSTSGKIRRDACLHVSYDEHGSDNVDIVPSSAGANLTRTDNITFLSGATNKSTDKWSGTVEEGVTTKIAEYTITAASGYHLSVQSGGNGIDASWFNRLSNSPWAPYYTWNVIDTYYTSTGNTNKIQRSVIEIYYTSPVNVFGLDPDPISGEGDFCSFLHDIRLNYLSRPLVTKNSLGKRVTRAAVLKSVVSPTDTVTIQIDSTGYTPPTDVNGLFYSMAVKLNTAQNGITHAWNWNTSAWVATTDLTGNTGPHGIGNNQGAAAAQGNSTNPYRLYTNAHVVTNNGTVFLQTIMPDDSSSPTGTYCVFFEAGDFTVNGVSNAPQNIALDSSIPTNINTGLTTSWECVGNVTSTISSNDITNVTTSGSDVTVTAGRSLQAITAQQELDFPFTFTYTRTASRTLSIIRQPVIEDFVGFDNTYATGGSDNAGATIHIADTTGIKVGAYVEDQGFLDGENTNRLSKTSETVITSVTTNDSIGVSPNHSGITTVSDVRIFSDWKYELLNAKAVINDANTVVTVTGTIRVRQYGKSSPDGNITLQPGNFITSTSN